VPKPVAGSRKVAACDNRTVSPEPIRVAVVGAGAFGRNHARVYHELENDGAVKFAAVVDADLERARAIATEFGTEAFASVEQMLAQGGVQAASVAVPTVHHLPVARELMRNGVDVLIEKPIATTLAEADELIALAREHGRVGQVGHLERFNPAVQGAMKVLTRPLFYEVHRLSIFGPRALDVDVILDLMIHDIDLVLTMTRSPLTAVHAVGIPILSGKVDIANVRMEFESGCVANLTASRVSTERVRKMRFFQPHQYVSVDYSRQDLLVLSVNMDVLRSGKLAPENLMSLIRPEKPAIAQQEPLKAEIGAFVDAVRRRAAPAVSLEEGRRALDVALQILNKIERHTRALDLANVTK
jgi:predicted dehydrogenase